jgi:formylglycine-generating enzyme required for sulfatase activity
MLLVPPGTFQMGCSQGSTLYGCHPEEQPEHAVTLTRAIYLGRYEVTQSQWQARMGSNPSYFQGLPDSSNRPVEYVSWNTIQGFLAATGTRLPTEAEWERACRAGTTTAFHGTPDDPLGTNDDRRAANFIAWIGEGIATETKPVGQKLGNGLGFHDMSGNIWEYVADLFGDSYYAVSPTTDPRGPDSHPNGWHVMRGGAHAHPDWCRSSARAAGDIGDRYRGFRVARDP